MTVTERGPVGSAGVVEQGKGIGWAAREPVSPRTRPRVQHAGKGKPADQVPGLLSDLRAQQERFGEHEHRRNAWGLEPNP